jgi:hypothetical protein
MKRSTRTFLIVMAMMTILATVSPGARAAGRGHDPSCAVSPNPVVSGRRPDRLRNGRPQRDWVNPYIYYSGGSWEILGGQIGSGGSFSLWGMAQSFWGPSPSGAATVQIYAGSANNLMKMDTTTCSFSVS